MALPGRQAEFNQVIADLSHWCATRIQTWPRTTRIARLREQASDALGTLGFNSGEPQ
jgi:hypothetical protein